MDRLPEPCSRCAHSATSRPCVIDPSRTKRRVQPRASVIDIKSDDMFVLICSDLYRTRPQPQPPSSHDESSRNGSVPLPPDSLSTSDESNKSKQGSSAVIKHHRPAPAGSPQWVIEDHPPALTVSSKDTYLLGEVYLSKDEAQACFQE